MAEYTLNDLLQIENCNLRGFHLSHKTVARRTKVGTSDIGYVKRAILAKLYDQEMPRPDSVLWTSEVPNQKVAESLASFNAGYIRGMLERNLLSLTDSFHSQNYRWNKNDSSVSWYANCNMVLRIDATNWALLNLYIGKQIPENIWRELGVTAFMANDCYEGTSLIKSIGVIKIPSVNSLEGVSQAELALRESKQYYDYARDSLEFASELLSEMPTTQPIMPNPASGQCAGCEVDHCQFSSHYKPKGEKILS